MSFNVIDATNRLDTLLPKTNAVQSRQDPGWKELSQEMFNLAHSITVEIRGRSEGLTAEGNKLRSAVSQLIRELEAGRRAEVSRQVGEALKYSASIRKWVQR